MTRLGMPLAGLAVLCTAPALAGPAGTPTNPPAMETASAPMSDRGPDAERATEALNLLEANGYVNFRDFQREGKNYTVSAWVNGALRVVTVDPDTHEVSVH
jgi:hypothetical protein